MDVAREEVGFWAPATASQEAERGPRGSCWTTLSVWKFPRGSCWVLGPGLSSQEAERGEEVVGCWGPATAS
ncbi:MAG: hypothetical protein ACPG4T_16070 [Nannocystaceae bacterium]